ncbi:MAG: MerR family transcriptional regulator [Nitrospiraceae bacterium]
MAAEPRLGGKVFYKIGEVSEITQLPAYVLRFWESQFSFLKPRKSRGRQRLYVRQDIERVFEIKRMLYEEGYTIAGVKRFWRRRGHRVLQPREVAERVRADLRAILRTIESYDRYALKERRTTVVVESRR